MQVAHCALLGYANRNIDIKNVHILVTIFQQLAVKCFEGKAASVIYLFFCFIKWGYMSWQWPC